MLHITELSVQKCIRASKHEFKGVKEEGHLLQMNACMIVLAGRGLQGTMV